MYRVILGIVFVTAITFFGSAKSYAQLSSEAQFDLLRIEISESLKNGQHQAFLDHLKEFETMGGEIDSEILYFKATSLKELGRYEDAQQAVTLYINSVGSEGVRYREALMLYRELDGGAPQAPQIVNRQAAEVTQTIAAANDRGNASGKMKIGEVASINRDFGFLVLRLSMAVPVGATLMIDSNSGLVEAEVSRKNDGGEYSATLTDRSQLARIRARASVFLN